MSLIRRAILEVREIIVGAAPAISVGVEWNAPGFRATEWFHPTPARTRRCPTVNASLRLITPQVRNDNDTHPGVVQHAARHGLLPDSIEALTLV